MAHAHSLRVEVGEKELADQLEVAGWEQADLAPEEQALCAYADKLTRTPGAMVEADVERLRAAEAGQGPIVELCGIPPQAARIMGRVCTDDEPRRGAASV